ncbi:MAG: FHA domain-containing protein, partial [Planctomycetes bacterium]|nr:FHA domain-containing protein [Planctomycetota bacterium]
MSPAASRSEPYLVLTLRCPSKPEACRQWRFSGEESIQIGRAPDNDVCLADDRVSRYHATLFFDGAHWRLSCFGRNGTYVDGVRTDHCILLNGMTLQLARMGPRLVVEVSGSASNGKESEETEPVTVWLERLRHGDEQAAEKLWQHYFQQIVQLARSRLDSGS